MKFNYLEPTTITEALSLLSRYNGKARVLAGGTDLMVQMRDKTIAPEYVVDIANVLGLDYISYDEKRGLRIGALTTLRTVERSEIIRRVYPVLSQAAGKVGSVAIRNMATIGGNLCNAAPSADTAPGLIGLSATVKIVGIKGEREVPAESFSTGPGCTICDTGELLTEIQVPIPASGTRGIYLKLRRTAVDLALVGVAIVMVLEAEKVCREIKIVLGAVAPTPIRSRYAEEVLRGKKIEPALIEKAAQVACDEARPINDVRASAEYRKRMVGILVRRALERIITGERDNSTGGMR